jgi:hypothetical protein
MAVTVDKIGTKTSRADNFIGSAFATRDFGNNTSGGITVDLDTSHDKIADSKGKRRAQVGTKGKRKCRPAAGTIRMTLVPSTGLLFQA